MCSNVFTVNSKMYFLFNILALILVKSFISVDSNTTIASEDPQNLRTTSSDLTNVLQDNDRMAVAADTTQWFSQRIVTERPTTEFVTQRKDTTTDAERYTTVSVLE